MWSAVVPLACFCIVEKHQPDRVLRQFGLVQDIPIDVDTNERLHGIDLRGKVDRNWRITWKYINRSNALLDFMIKKHLELLQRIPVGSQEHKHILDVPKAVNELDRVRANND
nr:serine/threonine-protein phosphatase 7 long form like [Quercus suber]